MKATLLVFALFLILAAVLYPFFGDSPQIHLFGNAGEIAGLVLAVINLYCVQKSFSSADIPRKAWMYLTFGAFLWLIAQLLTMYCELVLKRVAHGTIADLFWLLGYFLLFFGVALVVRNFVRSGLPIGSRSSYILQFLILAGIFATIFFTLIWQPLIDPNRGLLLKMLDVTYPVFDFILILLASILARFCWLLRGSGIARSWILLCATFGLVAAGDIALGYTTDFNSLLYRLLDVVYFSAYFVLALAAANQLEGQKRAQTVSRLA